MSDYRSSCCARYPDPSKTFTLGVVHGLPHSIDVCPVCNHELFKICSDLLMAVTHKMIAASIARININDCLDDADKELIKKIRELLPPDVLIRMAHE